MEHDDKSLPIAPRTLGSYAQKCHAFAKALHYKELEWSAEPSSETIEALIRINNQLQQPDVAVGILTHAQSVHHIELKEDWYEKLERWDDALEAYEKKQLEDPNDFDLKLGRMRCLHALGEWESLSDLAKANFRSASSEQRRKIAPLAAAASWGLAQWEVRRSASSMQCFKLIPRLLCRPWTTTSLFSSQIRRTERGSVLFYRFTATNSSKLSSTSAALATF